MAAMYPAQNDPIPILAFKWAQNVYETAVAKGVTGLTAPIYGSREQQLYRLIAYYYARMDT
jgi:hypothetical protein